MRYSGNAIAAAALLGINMICAAQSMPTDQDIARQKADFTKSLDQIPQSLAPTDRLGAKLNHGVFVQPKVDPEEIARRYANAAKKPPANATDLMIFISFSMPRDVIAELSKQAKQYGATLMLRGFSNDSMTRTEQIAQTMNPGGAVWQINPDAFKTFKIQVVPAFVLATAGASSILEQGCAKPTSYVAVNGIQSIDVALQTIRRRSSNPILAASADRRLSK